MKAISIFFFAPKLFIAKVTIGVTFSQGYFKLHLLFFLALTHQEMSNDPTPPQAKFCPNHVKVFFFNLQFHRLSQRGLQRKSQQKNFQKIVAYMGKSCLIARRDKKESANFFILLIVSAKGSASNSILTPKKTQRSNVLLFS